MDTVSHTISNGQYTRKVMRLALPMAVTQLMMMGSSFLCTTMLAQLGHEVLAASALIFSISLTVLIVSTSLLFSLSILIGHAYGAKDHLKVGYLYQQGLILSLMLCIPALLIYWNIYPILILFHQNPNVSKIVESFFHANIWRILPFFFSICNQQLCYGVHHQKVDMVANMLGIAVLLISANTLIFGKFGFPALGVAGFGYASALQAAFYLSFTTICLYFIEDFKKFNLFNFQFKRHWKELKNLFKVGWPISIQISAEVMSLFAITTLVGWLGTHALAAYQVINQYQFLILYPIFAVSQATGILVGQAYGAQRWTDIKKLGQSGIGVAAVISLFAGFIFITFTTQLSSLYLNQHDPENIPIISLLSSLFALMAMYQFLDTIRNVLIGALRGLLDTKYPMFVGILSIWLVGLPLGYLLAFSLHWGVQGMSWGWTLGMGLSVILLYYRWYKLSSKLQSK